jgi:hypothetical protein
MKNTTLHAFISYRRGGGSPYARIVADRLTSRKLEIFLDVDRMPSGHFDETLYRKIEDAANFILILTPGCLDRCKDPEDWVRREIVHAIKLGRNIIPIFTDGFTFPEKGSLPGDIQPLVTHHALAYNHELFDAFIEKLVSLMMFRRKTPLLLASIIAGSVILIGSGAIGVYLVNQPKGSHEVAAPAAAEQPSPTASYERSLPAADAVIPEEPAAPQPAGPKAPQSSMEGSRKSMQQTASVAGPDNFPSRSKNEESVMGEIKTIQDFETLSAKLRELKSRGLVTSGKKSAFVNPGDCFVVVVNKETKKIIAILDTTRPDRIDIVSNRAVPDFENVFNDRVLIWMEIN